MSSVYEGKERKRCREEDNSKMGETMVKAQKYECEWSVKALCGVSDEKTTMMMTAAMSLEEKESGEVGNISEEAGERKALGDVVGTMLEDWPFSWSFEEQVLGGWFWYPYSDGELMSGGVNYAENEEVLWEDDVWNLKDIKEIPKS